MIFNEILSEFAKRHPEKDAVITCERSITYGDLDLAVHGMARHLVERGLQCGDRVAVHWHSSVEFVVVMLGAWRARLNVVPVNPRMKRAEISYILEHSGARLCFSEPGYAELVSGVEVVTELPALKAGGEPLPAADPDAPAMILYTSGTTARPKGVIHTQRSLFEGSKRLVLAGVAPADTVLALTQLSHASGLMCAYFPGLILGATVVLLRSFNPAAALDLIERHKCTYIFALPAGLQQIVEEQVSRPRDLSSLRAIVAGGDTVPVALQKRIFNLLHLEVREGCGMTEVVPTAINLPGAVRAGSIGREPEGFSLRIIDWRGNDVVPGEVGELVIRGPANCIGYWNDPEATARLLEGGWLHTGDLGLCDEDGYYWFKGRVKQIIIRSGSNISPQEVEEALYQHAAVLEAGVVGLPDPTFGEIPIAFVALREGYDLTPDRLINHASALLSDYKVPARIYLMEELPKGLTGKVDRRRLREILLADADLIESKAVIRV